MSTRTPLLRESGEPFVLYGRRWVVLLAVCLLQLANAAVWATFMPITPQAALYFTDSADKGWIIDLLSLIFMVVYLPMAFHAMWSLNARGLRRTVVAAGWLNLLGATIRWGGNLAGRGGRGGLGAVFAGQTIAAVGQPAILACPTLLAAMWFGEHERALALTLGSMANPLGMAAASVMAPAIVGTNAMPSDAAMDSLLLWTLVPSAIAAVVAHAAIGDRPPTPPSFSAKAEHVGAFLDAIAAARRSKPFVLLAVVAGLGIGLFNALTTLMAQILAAHSYTDSQVGTASALLVGLGIVFAGAVAAVLDATQAFLGATRALFCCATASLVLFTLVANVAGHFTLVAVSTSVIGATCFAALPAMLELGAEILYPVSEGTSAGLLWLAGQLGGIVILLIMQQLGGGVGASPPGADPDMTLACWFVVLACGCATLLTFAIHTDYHRLDAERAAGGGSIQT